MFLDCTVIIVPIDTNEKFCLHCVDIVQTGSADASNFPLIEVVVAVVLLIIIIVVVVIVIVVIKRKHSVIFCNCVYRHNATLSVKAQP